MEKLGGVPGAGGAAGREDELESLGLGLFDVDVDLAECFENCPEWNVSAIVPPTRAKNSMMKHANYCNV